MDSYWEVVEPLFSSIKLDGPESYLTSIDKFPRSSAVLFAAHLSLAEVHNGGFLQLFWNQIGFIVPEGIEGFSSIGMPEMAEILREAARPLGDPYPRDREQRWDAMLVASGLTELQLQRIFEASDKGAKGLYTAFAEATRSLGFGELETRFWETAKVENGGFQTAATRFANKFA